MQSLLNTDILIIGSGLAGATAAITAAEEGKKVMIITKTHNLKSGIHLCTRWYCLYKQI